LATSLKRLTFLISTLVGPKKFLMVSSSGASIMKYPCDTRFHFLDSSRMPQQVQCPHCAYVSLKKVLLALSFPACVVMGHSEAGCVCSATNNISRTDLILWRLRSSWRRLRSHVSVLATIRHRFTVGVSHREPDSISKNAHHIK